MKAITFRPASALPEMARGLYQQMVWWGHDVRHPDGNLLKIFGLQRIPSQGLQGTSCYRIAWQGGFIELHGAVASWTSPDERVGCIFERDRARVELWHSGEAPIPGRDHGESGDAATRWEAALPLIRWVRTYELWISRTRPHTWREGCWRAIRRLPRGKPWLPPANALRWWGLAAEFRAPAQGNNPKDPVSCRTAGSARE